MHKLTIWHCFGKRHRFAISSKETQLPTFSVTNDVRYTEDALALYNLLYEHLPSGTWERLCALFALRMKDENDY